MQNQIRSIREMLIRILPLNACGSGRKINSIIILVCSDFQIWGRHSKSLLVLRNGINTSFKINSILFSRLIMFSFLTYFIDIQEFLLIIIFIQISPFLSYLTKHGNQQRSLFSCLQKAKLNSFCSQVLIRIQKEISNTFGKFFKNLGIKFKNCSK